MSPDRQGIVRIVLQLCAVGLPLLLTLPKQARAAEPACEASYQARLDARLAAKAEEGGVALGQFVRRTKSVYQLDYNEAVMRVERHRRAAAACTVASNARS